ncbi:MAG: histidine kinase [Opitutaceae bacterium]|nr:histidine kinase [Opitutaceae bacterium]
MRHFVGLRPLAITPAQYPWRRRWLGSVRYWLCQLLGWGSLGGLFLLANISVDRPHVWVVPAGMFAGGLLCSHLLRIVMLRVRARVRSWSGFLVRILAWNVYLGMGMTGLAHGAAYAFAPELLERSRLPPLVAYCVPVVEMATLFTLWVGLYLGLAYVRGYQEKLREQAKLEAVLKEAELRVVKAQINPHFLFNSLNTLRALITQDPQQAREAVTLLADLLRAALTTNLQPAIPLAQELETVRSYLALEGLRYEERLRVRWSVADEALAWPLPPSTLQSLVENALKYGIAPQISGGEISIEAALREGRLCLTVLNPGTLATASNSTSLGLSNTRRRLHHLCGPQATLTLAQRAPDLVAAVLIIPPPLATPESVAELHGAR